MTSLFHLAWRPQVHPCRSMCQNFLPFKKLGNILHGLPSHLSDKESSCQCRRLRFNPWVRKTPWRRKRQPTSVFLPGESHGQRNLAGYSPWGHKESDTTEQLTLSLSFIMCVCVCVCVYTYIYTHIPIYEEWGIKMLAVNCLWVVVFISFLYFLVYFHFSQYSKKKCLLARGVAQTCRFAGIPQRRTVQWVKVRQWPEQTLVTRLSLMAVGSGMKPLLKETQHLLLSAGEFNS